MSVTSTPIREVVDHRLLQDLVERVVARPRADRWPAAAPFTGETLVEIPVSAPDDVEAAFAAAREAQRHWAARPVVQRARVIGRIHDLVLDRQSLIADVIQAESGKARRDAFEEIADVALAARYTAVKGPRLLRDRARLGLIPGLTRSVEVRQPKGVVGIISPWNYPLTLAISDALPAFVAGNAVVHKPDLRATLSALLARSIAVEAGLPEALWQIVAGDGPTVGAEIVARADYVSFTGASSTGRVVAARLGDRLVESSLELGGKNPMIVLDDADIERAAEGAVRASFSNAGQLCMAKERIYVAERVRDEFVERFLARVAGLRLGAAFDYSVDVGSLVSQAQVDKVTAHIEDAVAKGARILAGGRARPDIGPYFFEPTVLDGVRPGMLVADEETFGPVVSIFTVRSDDEAVERANDSRFGLNASVWTRDTRRGLAIARRLRSGVVGVNDGYASAWGSHDLPIGGMKDSGLGRRHGRDGILRYTEAQAIAVQRIRGVAPLPHMTYAQFAELLTMSLRAMRWVGRA